MSMTVLSHAPRLRWPWLLLAGLLAMGATLCWQFWPQLLLQSVIWQKQLHQQMTALLQQVAADPQHAGGILLGFSILYGILHAAGPGHGKVVIATFLATHPTQLKTSIRLTLMAALLQGLMAIMLVTLLLVVLQLSSRQLHLSSYWMEKGSYLLVIALGVWLCWRNGKRLWLALKPRTATIRQIRPLDHQHHADCGCGHQHVPDSRQLAQAVGWKTQLLLVLSMGLRPCSGAIMMLLFAKVIGVYRWGVFSALAMALGTALTVTAMALLVQSARALAVKLNRRPAGAAVTLPLLALMGGGLLILVGSLLWFSTQPALSGGLRPLFLR